MDTKPWWQSKTIIGAIAAAAPTIVMIFKYFGINLEDQVGPFIDGLASVLGFFGVIFAIYGRIKAKFQIGTNKLLSSPMVKVLIAPLLLAAIITQSSCAQGPVYPGSATAVVGSDFQKAATDAIAAYAEYKSGNVDMTWALQKMFSAYSLYSVTSHDVKGLVKQWTGNAGDSQALADRLARIFGGSTAPPAVKMAVLAKSAQVVAQSKGG